MARPRRLRRPPRRIDPAVIDARFYEVGAARPVRTLAAGFEIGGDPATLVKSAAPAGRAGPGDLCFLEKASTPLANAPAACVLSPGAAHFAPKASALILSDRPRATFARLASKLITLRVHEGDARIHPDARLEDDVRLGPGVVIGQGAQIGAGVVIGANAVIGPGVAIGRRTRIGANATILCALIGDDVTILSGAVIGEQGFGVAADAQGLVEVPHFGRAIIQDRALIGANTTIDRGAFDDTQIGEDAKIDNLCQIAHQVQIGRGAMIAAFGGISGSSVVGDGVMMGGRVGLGDHRTVGKGAVLAAGSAVLQDVPAGETWGGYPAKPLRKFLRETAWLARKASGGRDGRE